METHLFPCEKNSVFLECGERSSRGVLHHSIRTCHTSEFYGWRAPQFALRKINILDDNKFFHCWRDIEKGRTPFSKIQQRQTFLVIKQCPMEGCSSWSWSSLEGPWGKDPLNYDLPIYQIYELSRQKTFLFVKLLGVRGWHLGFFSMQRKKTHSTSCLPSLIFTFWLIEWYPAIILTNIFLHPSIRSV